VQDAEAGEHFDTAVVHGDGEVDDDFAGRIAQDLPKAVVEVEFMRCEVESSSLCFPWIDFLLERDGCHKCFVLSFDRAVVPEKWIPAKPMEYRPPDSRGARGEAAIGVQLSASGCSEVTMLRFFLNSLI
jgi:hypothetical protein